MLLNILASYTLTNDVIYTCGDVEFENVEIFGKTMKHGELTHLYRMGLPTLINRMNPLPLLGVLGDIFSFIQTLI